jgi:hypothetical protein
MIEATLGMWNPQTKTLDAEIQAIESLPRLPAVLKPRRKCEARKQHNRMLQM